MEKNRKFEFPIRIICAVLFALFSFFYIYLFQGEQLALVQDFLSQGKTTNNAFITATIITLLLLVLQFLINRIGKLHGRYEAFSYLPSCVLLALLTKVDAYLSYSLWQWVIALAVVAVLYALVVWVERNTLLSREVKFLRELNTNLMVMAVMFVFAGWYGNNSPAQQMELAAWKYAHDGDYESVLRVGNRSLDTNANLTALRGLAMAKTGRLGELLFAYPQPYGAEGLLMNRYKVQTTAYGAEEFYKLLGDCPYGGEKAVAFYKRMMKQYETEEYRSLYAAALLLDKNLVDFVSLTIDGNLTVESLSEAPVCYQEAWMIYNEQHPFSPVEFEPQGWITERYHEYLSLREEYASDVVSMQSLSHRWFGNTYWYYYDFVK